MAKPVLHMSWVKANAFGGITTTTQCNRNTYRGQSSGMNIAERDEDVSCKFCLAIIRDGRVRASINVGETANA